MGFTWLDNTQYYFQGKNIFNNQCLSYFIIMNKDRTIGYSENSKLELSKYMTNKNKKIIIGKEFEKIIRVGKLKKILDEKTFI